MKVIVFGGSGFLGSHVADALTAAGHNVTIFDLVPSKHLQKAQSMVIGDIMDEKLVLRAVKGCDVAYNFAGVADIEEANARPLDCIKSNILGNSIILEACRKSKVRRFVFASSLYVYSKAGSFYRSTKQACELLVENYSEVFGLKYTILRYGSLYGPRADEKNFIHRVLTQAVKEGRIVREGDGEEIREYIHVCDAARCSVEILSDDFINEYVIITGSQQMKVKDLLGMVKEMLDNKVKVEYVEPRANLHYEITPYCFAPKMAKRIVSRTYLDLSQGILESIRSIHRVFSSQAIGDAMVTNRKRAVRSSSSKSR
ncbi:MAG: NAD(P)-dependent oxidoreductase [Candidatus Omnitrophica bacterium]|nr:NAD(P)-dependent oxidoreductase [Candidatus Omnitrophota bacterium]